MVKASPICRRLEAHAALRAVARAWAKTGNRIAARMAMMAITTSNSISVKPLVLRTLPSSGAIAGLSKLDSRSAGIVAGGDGEFLPAGGLRAVGGGDGAGQ